MKVGSMRRGKRILLVTTLLLLAVANGDVQAGLWRSRKAQPAVENAPAATTLVLTAVEADATQVTLRTSGTPAYTSYSPSPDVFVVDLTGTGRPADLVIPATLPAGLAGLAAEEAVEMGNRLTRVTFRFYGPVTPRASAAENGVVISIPAPAGTEVVVAPAEETPALPVVVAETAPVETQPVVEEPAPQRVLEPVSARKATKLSRVATSGSGSSLEVQIAGNGGLTYKAFRLNNPERLVIDVQGVKNAVAKPTVNVNDDPVQRVRVAQFAAGADPITRVVVDLNTKTEYAITPTGDKLLVTFGNDASQKVLAASAPVTVAEKPAPKPAASLDEIPVVADSATWKMPETGAARQVINSPADQAPPDTTRRPATLTTATTTTTENVFDDAAAQTQPGGRTLSGSGRVFSGDPISLNLKDADIKDVLRTFAQLTGLNIAVDPQVSGSVTVDFVDVPWDQALDLILRQNGLTYVLEGNVMRIGTIDRLAAETAASRRLAEEERLNVTLTTLGFKLSYARATEVAALLKDLASPRAKIIVDARTNQLIISEVPQNLQVMRNLIDTVDIPNRQVVIEARVVETTKTFTRNFGFEWNFGGALDPALGSGTGLIFPNRIGFSGGPFSFTGGAPQVFGVILSDVLGTFTLDLALHAAETENLVRVVSAPKVTTQDNTPAEIQSGVQIPYQTRVNFTTTITYIDATLRLSVTPQITEAGTIIMDIAVQKTTPGEPIEGAAGTPLSTRQARTRVMVRDGGTAVIGGIYQASDTQGQSRVPVLGQIPVLGALFRSNSMRTQHDELLIFITPRIVRGT
jgi:type IV pilus assembly protein PilQ